MIEHLQSGGIYVGSSIGNIENFYLIGMDAQGQIFRQELRQRKRELENTLRVIKESRKKYERFMKENNYENNTEII